MCLCAFYHSEFCPLLIRFFWEYNKSDKLVKIDNIFLVSILIWTLVWNLKREKMWTIFFRMKLDELWRWNYLCWKQKLISEIAVYQKRRPVKCGILLNEVQTPKRNFFKFRNIFFSFHQVWHVFYCLKLFVLACRWL
jgi:hypothetical protein